MTETPSDVLARLFREIDAAIALTRQEVKAMTTEETIPSVPSAATWYKTLFRAGIPLCPVSRSIPYVCAQVGRLGRGKIGLNSDGQVVFYFPVEDIDKIGNEGLRDAEEVWIVLRANDSLTNPYS